MQKTATLAREQAKIVHNVELFGYLTTKNIRKNLAIYEQDCEYISSYKDYKKDERALKSLKTSDKLVKNKKIIQLT